MSLQTWLFYAAAVFVLTVTPDPSVLMCVTQGAHHGARRAGFAALGSVTAVVGIMVCLAIGLGAALAASEQAFSLIKWLGVAYLVYVGVRMLRSNASSFDVPTDGAASASRFSLYVEGLLPRSLQASRRGCG